MNACQAGAFKDNSTGDWEVQLHGDYNGAGMQILAEYQ